MTKQKKARKNMIQKLILSQSISDVIRNIAIGCIGITITSCHISHRQNHNRTVTVPTYILLTITGCILLHGLLSAGYVLMLLFN